MATTTRRFMPYIRIALLAGSLWALRREFAGVSLASLLRQLAGHGWARVAAGIAATVLSFLLLGGVELLALHTTLAGVRRIPRRIAMATAFVAHAMSQSVGLALLTGAAVRMRAYERRGMDAAQVGSASALVTLGVTLGLVAAAAWAFLAEGAPMVVRGHALAVRPIGVLLALMVVAYFAWSIFGSSRVGAKSRWHIPRPAPAIALALMLLATADWLMSGAVLYVFLPSDTHIPIWGFMRTYIVAQTVGVTSHVPAGAGVFEVVLLGLLTTAYPSVDRAAFLAAIVLYRAVYYLLPLCAAVALAGITELLRSRRGASHRAAPFTQAEVEVAT
ncbi:MAG: hypothetical protein ABIY52_06470 [Gemmatimonadaceae bacterium]